MAAYGSRTGVTTLIRLVKTLCVFYSKYKPSIDAWIRANAFGSDATVAIAGLSALQATCDIIQILPDD